MDYIVFMIIKRDLTVQDVKDVFKTKIVERPKLKKLKKGDRQQILPTLQEDIDKKDGQYTLFC